MSAVTGEAAEMPAGSSHAERVLSCLNQQRAAGKFCDAAINVGDGALVYAHRNILACFSKLFQSPGGPTALSMEICLQECPSDGLELLLNFMYTGRLKLDENNLSQVKNAAASLCIPEALLLCQQFLETPADQMPVKRRRGRPRKTTANFTVKEENLLTDTKEEYHSDAATAGVDDITTAAPTTTTRSGRVVKGPKRLVTDENPSIDLITSETTSKKVQHKKEGRVLVDHPDTDGTSQTDDTQNAVIENSCSVDSQAAEGDDNDDDLDEVMAEDSDEDYEPDFQPSSSAPCTSTSHRPKVPGEVMMTEEGQAKKDSVQCPICDKSFKSKYYLKVHNRRHTGEKPFGCSKCGKRYFRKENLIIHQIRDCSKVITYSCPICSSTFNGKEPLRLHMISHTGDMPYKCSSCPEQFLYKKNLTFHMMKIHGFPKPHACPQCPKTFLTKTELRVHEAAKHRGEKPFVCEECGHRVASRNGLQIHIKAIHRKEKPYVCTFCGHAFSQKNNLNMHIRIHSGEKPYQCHLCGKTFRTQASLDKHHRTHTGERPFGCDVCEQRFTEKGALDRHKASKHEEGRPHCCHVCGKTFKAKEQLRVHVRRHRGMRKFECTDCGYKFTRQAHLRRHLLIHKRTENYNPRQRKLRNVVVQEAERSSAEVQFLKPEKKVHRSPEQEQEEEMEEEHVQNTSDSQDNTDHRDISPEHSSTCMMRVELEPGHQVMEVVVSDQNQKSFSVPNVLEQSKLITEAYEFTVNMEDIADSVSERTQV